MVNDNVSTDDIINLIDTYKKKLKDQLKNDPNNCLLEGKMAAANEIGHRVLILGRGGLRIIE